MDTAIKLLPLILLIALAAYFISRGSRTKPTTDRNADGIAGGPGDNRANE